MSDVSNLSEFHARATSVAVVKMLSGKHFSLCDLDAIAKVLGRESVLAGRDYAALRSVHCVDWADMGPDLSRMVREKCLEMLGLPPQVLETIKPEPGARASASEPTHQPASRLRLAFWRQS
jgi:hypothetical protein